jgi:hypothetical protein
LRSASSTGSKRARQVLPRRGIGVGAPPELVEGAVDIRARPRQLLAVLAVGGARLAQGADRDHQVLRPTVAPVLLHRPEHRARVAMRDAPAFLVASLRLRRRFREAPGGVAPALAAEPTRRTFWTCSVWTGEDGMRLFAADPRHVEVMRRFRPAMAASALSPGRHRRAPRPAGPRSALGSRRRLPPRKETAPPRGGRAPAPGALPCKDRPGGR